MQPKTKAILQIALACTLWSFAGVLAKKVPWDAISIVGFRSIIALLLVGISRRSFRPKLTKGTWIGAIAVLTTAILFIFANKRTSAANAIVLQYAMPIFVILYSVIFRRKRPSRLELGTVMAASAGIILCFAQGLKGGGMLGDLLSLTSAVTYSVMFLAGQRDDCDALSYTFLGALIGCALLLFMPFDPAIRANPLEWLMAALMGVCLGHQAIGQAFGGKVVRAPVPMHGKVDSMRHAGRGVLKGLPSPFRATRYHSLVVERGSLPACLEVTGETEDGLIMALSHKELPIHGVQFHPESIESEHGHTILKNFLDTTRRPLETAA